MNPTRADGLFLVILCYISVHSLKLNQTAALIWAVSSCHASDAAENRPAGRQLCPVSLRQFTNYQCVTVCAGLLPVFSEGGSSAESQR